MKLNIGMVTGGLKFQGDTLEKGSLGGSETAFLCVARELAKRGHSVRVWCNTDRPGRYDGVDYLPLESFDPCLPNTTFDLLIASRWPEYLSKPSRASLRILWLHDTLQSKDRLMGSIWQTDEVWLLSDYHIEDYCGKPGDEPSEDNPKLPELRPIVWKTSNGVDMDLVQANLRPKVKGKVIYTSRPERGLLNLMSMLPKLVELNPDFKLYYANYSLEGMQLPPEVVQTVQTCDRIAADFPQHVVRLGHLTKAQLYQEISSSELMLYPSAFPEISCITAMEAQACGTPIFATDDFALSETVVNHKTGILIKGDPTTPAYKDEFVLKVTRLLQKPEVLEMYSKRGPESVRDRGYTWAQVAESWEARVTYLLGNRSLTQREGVIRRLLHNGDVEAAWAIVDTAPELVPLVDTHFDEVARANPVDVAKIPQIVRQLRPVFMRSAELLPTSPKSVLDFSVGHSPFGFFAAKNFPDVFVTIVHEDTDLMQRFAESLKLDNVQIIPSFNEIPRDVKFDLVYLGGTLSNTGAPDIIVGLASERLNPGGHIGLYTGYGPNAHTLGDTVADRLWSLDFEDFRRLFPTDFAEFSASFLPDEKLGINSGYWVGMAKVPDPDNFTRGGQRNTDWNYHDAIERRRLLTRPYQRIGVGMITKNEEANIIKCLKAISPYVDQIVMTDTGSSDSTMPLAIQHGATVYQAEFDNFSQARNAHRDKIEAEWYVWVDADEEMIGGESLRKYADSPLYNGYVVAQRHLMLDVHGTFDTPIRMLRNKPEYKFTGLIHEHAEDTARGPYGNGIRPALVLHEVNLAHYGYPSEQIRRKKCSSRNMELLIRDLQENPDRPVNKLLFMRDCLNIVKWHMSGGHQVTRNSHLHALLNTCCALYFQHFDDPKNKLHGMTDPMYQEALKILAGHGLPFEDRKTPPFEIALALSAGLGEPAKVEGLKPATRLFVDTDQFNAYMAHKLSEINSRVSLVNDKVERPKTRYLTDTVAAIELLKLGANLFK